MPACGGSTIPLNTKVLLFEACHACNRALRYTIPGMHYEPPSVGNDDRQTTPREGQMIFNAIPIARTCPRVRHQTKTPKQPKARVSQRSVRSRFGLGHRRFFSIQIERFASDPPNNTQHYLFRAYSSSSIRFLHRYHGRGSGPAGLERRCVQAWPRALQGLLDGLCFPPPPHAHRPALFRKNRVRFVQSSCGSR